jgi:hypothetical protein
VYNVALTPKSTLLFLFYFIHKKFSLLFQPNARAKLQANSKIVYRQLQRVAKTNELWICQMSRAGIPTFRFLNVRRVDISDKLMGISLDIEGPQVQGQRPSRANEGASHGVIGRYRFLRSWLP